MRSSFINIVFRGGIIMILVLGSITSRAQTTRLRPKERPVNVILLIGDGMGLSQMSAAFYYQDSLPSISYFPVTGLITTSSCSDKITDSAAGATAFSTGKKTSNGRVGEGPDGKALETLVEYFSKRGKSTGLISTASITHATPAAFYAHNSSRNHRRSIGKELPGSGVDFFAGGGLDDFSGATLAAFRENGFTLYTDSLRSLQSMSKAQKIGFLLAGDGMPAMYEGRGEFLAESTRIGLEFLARDPEGFFLMVEGAQIDWGGHANNGSYLVQEVLDFDRAIGVALDFAKNHGRTLVIVTADHETGGFTLAAEEKKHLGGSQPDYNSLEPRFSSGGHSAALIPVLTFGPGALRFSGTYPNTQLHEKIIRLVR